MFIVSELEVNDVLKKRIKSFPVYNDGSFSVTVDGKNPFSSQYSSMGGSVKNDNYNIGVLSIINQQLFKVVLSAQSHYDFLIHNYVIGEIDGGVFKNEKQSLIKRASKLIEGIIKKEEEWNNDK